MAALQNTTARFHNLHNHSFIRLTTFRKNGEAVPTPVWFAQSGDRLYVMTLAETGKVKRIRSNARVTVEPCTMQGKPLGEPAEGLARILPPEESRIADDLLNRKYGIQKRLFDLMRVRRPERVYIEIVPVI